MGVVHSIFRFLGCKTKDEEADDQYNHHPNSDISSNSSKRLHKLLSSDSLLCSAVNGLLQKVSFIFYLFIRPRKAAYPVLPIQSPAPTASTSSDPSLTQPLVLSSLNNDDSNTYRDQESRCDIVDVVSSQQWPEEINHLENTDSVIISIPEYTHSLAYTTVNEEITEETVPAENIAYLVKCEEREREVDDDSNTYHDQESRCDIVDVVSSQQWPEETIHSENKDSVIISIPEYTHSLAYTTANEEITEETVPAENVAYVVKGEEREREEEKVVIKSSYVVVVDEGRWIKHYSSRHRILLVGEGDFSFSASLAFAFRCASNIIATSLDSKAFLKTNYKNALANIEELNSRGCKVMHEIDATEMADHPLLGRLTFDRIIFNFPFAGFFKNLSRDSQLRRHRRLVSLFMKNAKEMISENGEIHVSHKTNGFHIEWNLELLASSHKLELIEAVKFNHLDYPGYNTKCGFGGDNYFNCNPSKTYKFGLKREFGY